MTDVPQRILRAELPKGTRLFRGRQIPKPGKNSPRRMAIVCKMLDRAVLRPKPVELLRALRPAHMAMLSEAILKASLEVLKLEIQHRN